MNGGVRGCVVRRRRGPVTDPTEATVEAHGVTVTITLGIDGVPLVFVDTDGVPDDKTHGPIMRVRLNDHLLHGQVTTMGRGE
jgi:hypothetical protein